jgi:PAS domain-containing protein
MGVSAGNGRVCARQLVQEALLGEAFGNASLAAIVLDEDGRSVAVNEHACAVTGYERDELVALGVPGIALGNGAPPAGTTRLRRKDGSELGVSFRGAATTVAGLPFFVVLFWEAGAETG